MKKLFPILTFVVGLATSAMASYPSSVRERLTGVTENVKETFGKVASSTHQSLRGGLQDARTKLSKGALTATCKAVSASTCINPHTFRNVLKMGCAGSTIQNCTKEFCAANCASADPDTCPTKDNMDLRKLCLQGCSSHFFGREDLHNYLFICLKDPRVEYMTALKRDHETISLAETIKDNQPLITKTIKAFQRAVISLEKYIAAKRLVDALRQELKRLGIDPVSLEGVSVEPLPVLGVTPPAPIASVDEVESTLDSLPFVNAEIEADPILKAEAPDPIATNTVALKPLTHAHWQMKEEDMVEKSSPVESVLSPVSIPTGLKSIPAARISDDVPAPITESAPAVRRAFVVKPASGRRVSAVRQVPQANKPLKALGRSKSMLEVRKYTMASEDNRQLVQDINHPNLQGFWGDDQE